VGKGRVLHKTAMMLPYSINDMQQHTHTQPQRCNTAMSPAQQCRTTSDAVRGKLLLACSLPRWMGENFPRHATCRYRTAEEHGHMRLRRPMLQNCITSAMIRHKQTPFTDTFACEKGDKQYCAPRLMDSSSALGPLSPEKGNRGASMSVEGEWTVGHCARSIEPA
jgi:hypothetical protein